MGLESIGLGDVRVLVKLMCLSAAQVTQSDLTPSKPHKHHSGKEGLRTDGDKDNLKYLSLAIGAMVQDNTNAAQLLLNLCTQVSTHTVG